MENNMERNQDNGRGMFYAVIGVATLIITIIGATFAYLTAATNSAANAVTATGAKIDLAYSDVKTGLKTDLIPINEDLTQFDKGGYTGKGFKLLASGDYELGDDSKPIAQDSVAYKFVGITRNDCRDVNGNNICSVYQFTVSNTATVSQRIFGSIVPKTNEFTNLRLAVFKGTSADVDATYAGDANGVGWDVDGTPVEDFTTDYNDTSDENYQFTKNADAASRKHVIGSKGDLVFKSNGNLSGTTAVPVPAFEQVLDPNESMTYTVVLYINETGSNQDVDQKKMFAGGINFTTEGGGSGVTGVLATSSD